MGTGFDMIQSLWVLSNYMKLKLKPLILTFLYAVSVQQVIIWRNSGCPGVPGSGGVGGGYGF